MAQVTAVGWVGSLAWELSNAVGGVERKSKRVKERKEGRRKGREKGRKKGGQKNLLLKSPFPASCGTRLYNPRIQIAQEGNPESMDPNSATVLFLLSF